MNWTTVVPGVVLLGLVIFVHELGHFLAAKIRGVRVLKFSLGFGPAIFKFTRGETEYRISWVPLGGYVQMAGDSPTDEGAMGGGPDEFLSHPWYGRLFIAAAGPLANLLTAFLVMVVVGLVGVSYPDYPNHIGAVPDTSVAGRLGVLEGDQIATIGNTPIHTWVQVFVAHSRIPDARPVDITLDRAGVPVRIHLTPEQREPFFSSLHRPPDPPVVGGVVIGMPAYKAGLKEGDEIQSVNGKAVDTWDDLPAAIQVHADKPVLLHVKRGGSDFDLTVTPVSPEAGKSNGRIGIEPPRRGTYVEHHTLLESLDLGLRGTVALIANVYGGMWLTVSRPLYYREYLGGPLFIAQEASQQAKRGLDSYLQFLALINIAIMAFNLLPIPVLDGGHMLLAVIEGFRRQALSARAYIRFQKVGLIVIGTLFVLIIANDPLRLVQRQRALDRAPQETTHAPAPAGGR